MVYCTRSEMNKFVNVPSFEVTHRTTSTNRSKEAQEKIEFLESKNAFLEEKVKVLKHQILSIAGGGKNGLPAQSHSTRASVRPPSAALFGTPNSSRLRAAENGELTDEETFQTPVTGRAMNSSRREARVRRNGSARRDPQFGTSAAGNYYASAARSTRANNRLKMSPGADSGEPRGGGMPQQAIELLEEAKSENLRLHAEVQDLKSQVTINYHN
jgi:hypothetical protein